MELYSAAMGQSYNGSESYFFFFFFFFIYTYRMDFAFDRLYGNGTLFGHQRAQMYMGGWGVGGGHLVVISLCSMQSVDIARKILVATTTCP
jgi:hypothetical protein